MLFACANGPDKKHDPAREMRFPRVYMTAKGPGLPVRSLVNRKNEPTSRMRPRTKQQRQPKMRCCQVKEGHHQHMSSSICSHHVLGRASTPRRRRAESMKEGDEEAKAAWAEEVEEWEAPRPGFRPASRFIGWKHEGTLWRGLGVVRGSCKLME